MQLFNTRKIYVLGSGFIAFCLHKYAHLISSSRPVVMFVYIMHIYMHSQVYTLCNMHRSHAALYRSIFNEVEVTIPWDCGWVSVV